MGERGEQPVYRGGLQLLLGQLLIARARLGGVPLRGGDPLQERQAEPFGQGRGHDAATGSVGRRHGDQPRRRSGGLSGHGRSSPSWSRAAGATAADVTAAGATAADATAADVTAAGATAAGGLATRARVPDGSTSAHTTAEPARTPAETQNPTV